MSEGLTVRDWFAGQVLCGLSMHATCYDNMDVTAEQAYQMADEMLKARGPQ